MASAKDFSSETDTNREIVSQPDRRKNICPGSIAVGHKKTNLLFVNMKLEKGLILIYNERFLLVNTKYGALN